MIQIGNKVHLALKVEVFINDLFEKFYKNLSLSDSESLLSFKLHLLESLLRMLK